MVPYSEALAFSGDEGSSEGEVDLDEEPVEEELVGTDDVVLTSAWGPVIVPYSAGRARGYAASLYRLPQDAGSPLEVRLDAPALLDSRLATFGAMAGPVVFGIDLDPYPADELGHGVMRRCLEVCLRRGAPVAILTRSPLIERDLDLLRRLAAGPGVHVAVGLTMFDPEHARAFEPHVASPTRRIETLANLKRAHVPGVLSVAPAIWGVTDTDIVRLLSAAADAGAAAAYYRRLQLDADQAQRLLAHVRRTLPARVRRVATGLRYQMSDDAPEDPMRQIVEYTAASLGLPVLHDAPWLETHGEPRSSRTAPRRGEQLGLFGGDSSADGDEVPALQLPTM